MCAGVCAMLGLLHFLLWFRNRSFKYVLSTTMAMSAGVCALLELAMLRSTVIADYQQLLQLQNFFVYILLMSTVWLVDIQLDTARRWMAYLIATMWSIGMVINFLSPGSLVFEKISELTQHTVFWGEQFTVASGVENPWVWLVNIATLLILVYVIDASIRAWRHNNKQSAIVIGGGIVLFLLFGLVHSILVDSGVLESPYMVSFAYLAMVMAMSYDLASEITDRLKVQNELQQTRREMERLTRASVLGELASALAHEVNQPLAAILSNSQAALRFMENEQFNVEELREILEDIVRDDKRAGDVIRSLRAMLTKKEMASEKFHIKDAINEVATILHGELGAQQVTLQTDTAADVPEITARRIEIQQVLMNLLLNAEQVLHDVLSEQRVITVTAKIQEGMISVSVADNGPGIPAEQLPKIFDAFFTTKLESMGMGLAICKRIIEAHGGKITAENGSQGGAVFTFTLPV